MPDKIIAEMLLPGDMVSPDGEIKVVGSEVQENSNTITIELQIGEETSYWNLYRGMKVPIYNYD